MYSTNSLFYLDKYVRVSLEKLAAQSSDGMGCNPGAQGPTSALMDPRGTRMPMLAVVGPIPAAPLSSSACRAAQRGDLCRGAATRVLVRHGDRNFPAAFS